MNGIHAIYPLSAAAAGLGGLTSYLFACRTGRIRNNRHVVKAALEVAGGAITGFFLSAAGGAAGMGDPARVTAAFIGGVGWAAVIEVVRVKVTDVARALFFSAAPAGDEDGEG